jgi:hypothetical protein
VCVCVSLVCVLCVLCSCVYVRVHACLLVRVFLFSGHCPSPYFRWGCAQGHSGRGGSGINRHLKCPLRSALQGACDSGGMVWCDCPFPRVMVRSSCSRCYLGAMALLPSLPPVEQSAASALLGEPRLLWQGQCCSGLIEA